MAVKNPEKLTPEERDHLLMDVANKVDRLEHREAARSGAVAFQSAAKTASAVMTFILIAKTLWRAASGFIEAPK